MSHWYDHAIIYQIYPKSFQDSNDDGIGDLNGIRKRIPYLQNLGVNAVWLNPVFVSPQVDNGYDVSNYFAIDSHIGTMEDMENLIKDLHKAGIHIIMDFVLNHTSDQHPWFQDAIKNPDSLYRDYYIFAGHDNKQPNNWGSFFGGSVWEPDPAGTGQSYFHLFDKRMPDLNWKNPEVRHAMLEIAEFWLKKGIDGLRLDAFIHIGKADLRQNYPAMDDKPVIAEPFFANLPQVQEWMRPFCEQIKEDYPDALLLGEAASASVNLAVDYTNKRNHLMDCVITFRYFTEDDSKIDKSYSAQYQPKELDLTAFKQNQVVWQQTLADISQPTLYWNNHDMARLATRIAKTSTQAKSLAMLMYLQRGIPIIYYGEELGLKNLHFTSVDQFEDQTVAPWIKEAQKAGISRDAAFAMVSDTHKLPARGPMPWNDTENNGFTSAKPWLNGISQDDVTVANEVNSDNSMFTFYKNMLNLKKEKLFQDGTYYMISTGKDSYVYQRDLGNESAIVAVSLSNKKISIDLPEEYIKELLKAGEYQLTNGKLTLMPYAGVVLKKEN
ncbi:alpha-glucosidase [Lactobacillus acidophilus]|uniref:alpha-glucosidase n=1 Tax=Lactobacillus acidophilus TaxID=1579 RepID=UPI000354F35C|nr:alpha-glucosidase [Lactobacillus acidophilus]MCT3627896.1 alpha-glucosidase [Lactobacillus acidophilus]UEX75184.1 alpha-glucosidase [Lactobacillus acidophilus]UIP47693.1 alpha-glucosidase [Lactobacillus acidophilus]UTX29868.1 alpha-glucosidase [Lactobacillus acidophilus]UUY11473.1 alpha-glucosidase [Lactobacillus acidophilus]